MVNKASGVSERDLQTNHPYPKSKLAIGDGADVFARPSFYAEFAPRRDQATFVETIYVLKDRGRLTDSLVAFASPFRELAFIFRQDDPAGRVVFSEPSPSTRRKSRPFDGWIVGVKFKLTWSGSPGTQNPAIVACRDALADIAGRSGSCFEILDTVDRTLSEISSKATRALDSADRALDTTRARVSDLALRAGRSVRTLQRRVRSSTGCSPKHFLAMQRFRRSIYEIAAGSDALSDIACGLGFSDQAHLTREFRRLAGVTPGAFRQAWSRPRARTVRFLQDGEGATRLTMAVWPIEAASEAEAG